MSAADLRWTASEARELPLDAVRGAALFGVRMVHLVTDFRAPLARDIAHTHQRALEITAARSVTNDPRAGTLGSDSARRAPC